MSLVYFTFMRLIDSSDVCTGGFLVRTSDVGLVLLHRHHRAVQHFQMGSFGVQGSQSLVWT